MTKILLSHSPVNRANFYGDRALKELQQMGEVVLNPHDEVLSLEQLAELAQGCQIIVSSREAPAPAALFEQLPELLAVCRVAVDIRSIDVEAASRHGVLVTRATPGFDTSVSEWIIGVMIDLSRGITRAAAAFWQGQLPEALMGRELRGSVLGIVGYGCIGRKLAAVANALGMRVLVNDPHVIVGDVNIKQVSFEQLLSASDYVACLAPALAQTHNLFNARAFAAMQPHAFFINAARGELVDEEALLAALNNAQIAGCGLDVGLASVQMPSPQLAAHPRVIATPHVGGLTPPASEHQAMDTVRQVRAILAGVMPEGAVNPACASRAVAAFGLQALPEKALNND